MEIVNFNEIDDNRKDIYITDNRTKEKLLYISQDLYSMYQIPYEEMKTSKGLAKFLMAFGYNIALQKGEK